MNFVKKKFFLIFLFFYFFIGSSNSLKTGISFDEAYEELNWNFQVNVIKEISKTITHNKNFDRNKFNQEVKRFIGYGIGFQVISQPIQFILKDLIVKNKDLDDLGAKLIAKHFVVFLFFFISGIFFYLILRKLIDNEFSCVLGTILYLTYPYLFGQAMFSPKDIPFMSIWLICTYLSFQLFEQLVKKKNLSLKLIIFFSILSSYLLSIRIAGILIFFQYAFSLLIYISVYKINFFIFLKDYFKDLLFFIFFFLLFVFLFYPIFWINPLLLIETFKINISHFNNVGTNTLGEIMYSTNLPATYLIIWFAVKIPLLILIGFFIIPFTEKKILKDKTKSIFFGSLILTVILIPLILIIKKVHLYDEIRQVMFLIPLFFIISLVSLYSFSKRFFFIFVLSTIIFFVVESVKINPYQYVWFNLPSRYIDITKNFELEYQGISGREISQQLKKLDTQPLCILVNPIHSVKPFLNNSKFNCFDIWQKIHTNYNRPFLAVQNVRNLKTSTPYKCFTKYESGFNLLFYEKKIITGKLLECK